jgi:hypothetical protein
MEAWRQWLLGGRKNNASRSQNKIDLTPTGLLMEGVSTSLCSLFAFFGSFECKSGFKVKIHRVRATLPMTCITAETDRTG